MAGGSSLKAWRLSLEGFKNLSAVAGLEVGGALSGLTRSDLALTQSGFSTHYLPSQIIRPCVPSQDTAFVSARKHHRWHLDTISSQASNKVPSRSMAA